MEKTVATAGLAEEMAAHRAVIDHIDRQMVELLNQRAEHSLAIRCAKEQMGKPRFDPRREEEILERLCEANQGPLYNDNLREIFETILKVMKEVPLDE